MTIQALALLAAWTLATMAPALCQASGPVSLTTLISTGVDWGLLAAPAILVVALMILRWDRLGLRWPARASGFILLWPSLLCVLVMAALSVQAGLPAASVLGLVAFNTFFVGVSEELMFRGFLFRGLAERPAFWGAIWLSSLSFGMVHLLNGLITGDFAGAAIQAASAFMNGLFFMALRLRTASLYPGILIHWAWDMAVITMSLATATPGRAPAAAMTSSTAIGALLLSIPFALYGLFLLRKGRAACPEWAPESGLP